MNESTSLPNGATVFVAKKAQDDREAVCAAAVSLGIAVQPVDSLQTVNAVHDQTHPACLVADIPTLKKDDPDLVAVLDDSRMDTPAELTNAQADSHVLVASASILHDVQNAIDLGGITFLRQPFSRAELLQAIRLAISCDQEYQQQQANRQTILAAVAKLKPRERQVLNMLYQALSNKVIAKRLNVSERTVESMRDEILKAMQVRSVVDLVRLLAEAGYGVDLQRNGILE